MFPEPQKVPGARPWCSPLLSAAQGRQGRVSVGCVVSARVGAAKCICPWKVRLFIHHCQQWHIFDSIPATLKGNSYWPPTNCSMGTCASCVRSLLPYLCHEGFELYNTHTSPFYGPPYLFLSGRYGCVSQPNHTKNIRVRK